MNNLTGFVITTSLGEAVLSNDYSTKGFNCIKFNRTTSVGYHIVYATFDVSDYQGKYLQFSCDVLNLLGSTIYVQMKADTGSLQVGSVPFSNEMSNYSLTYLIPDDATTVQCIVTIPSLDDFKPAYTDNWILKETSQ